MAWLRRTWISWSAWSSPSALIIIIPAARSYISSCNRWPPFVSSCWNSLPPDIQSSASLSIVCQRLKTHLFHQSFPDVLLQHCFSRLRFRGLRNNICYFGDVNELWLTFAYCICPAGGWRQWMDRGWAGSAGKGSGSVPRWRSRPMGENLSDGWKIGQRGVCVHCIDRIRTR